MHVIGAISCTFPTSFGRDATAVKQIANKFEQSIILPHVKDVCYDAMLKHVTRDLIDFE